MSSEKTLSSDSESEDEIEQSSSKDCETLYNGCAKFGSFVDSLFGINKF